jgi:hypothetical protein
MWDTHVIVKMMSDKYVSATENSCHKKHYHSSSLQSHVYPVSFLTHEFGITLTYLSLTIFTIACNATGINRGRVNTGCVFFVSQMTHIQSLINGTGINRGKDTASINSTSVDACSIGKWLYVCHLWHEKDTVSVNSTSVDACSIGKWLYVYHLWHEKHTASVRGRVRSGSDFLVSQMTHIQSLTNVTGSTEVELILGDCILCVSSVTWERHRQY